ncbi:MAG: hypothetical protein H6811_04835 [Phycisphaeraceae bacterium]|nr:hypothetical protein [Phycisphaeraceae bacterium]
MAQRTREGRGESEGESGAKRVRMSRGQGLCLGTAILLMLVGGGLWIAARSMASEQSPALASSEKQAKSSAGEHAQGILPGQPPIGQTEPREGTGETGEESAYNLDQISPAVFRLGFSFAVGFAIAYALRMFLRLTLMFAGLMLLVLFGLEYAGMVTINWGALETSYDGVTQWLGQNTRSFGEFITGQLPSAASAVAGLVVGWRRRI